MSRRTSGRAVRTLKDHYRAAAREGDWHLCKQIAEQMRGLDGDGAEVQYALASALERLGERDEARKAYEVVLIIDSRHEKARTRLGALARHGELASFDVELDSDAIASHETEYALEHGDKEVRNVGQRGLDNGG
jgi:tetratricopeptide (TPR) repeat protein